MAATCRSAIPRRRYSAAPTSQSWRAVMTLRSRSKATLASTSRMTICAQLPFRCGSRLSGFNHAFGRRQMVDLVGTCPKDFWQEWIEEGDPAGTPETGEEWGWYTRHSFAKLAVPGDRFY